MSSEEAAGKRVSWVELYFDLIFVFAVGQLSHLMVADPHWGGLGRALGLFIPLWWTWIGFAVLYNRHGEDRTSQRLLVLAGTLPCAVAAIETHAAAGGHGLAFTFALAGARLILALAFAFTAGTARRVAIGYGLSAVAFAVSAFVPGPWRYGLWAIALLQEAGFLLLRNGERGDGERAHERSGQHPPARRSRTEAMRAMFRPPADPARRVDAGHLAERFGLMIIILLGEVVVAVAAAAAGCPGTTRGTGSGCWPGWSSRPPCGGSTSPRPPRSARTCCAPRAVTRPWRTASTPAATWGRRPRPGRDARRAGRSVAPVSDLKNRVHDLLPGLIGDLEDLVRIQSVSADPRRLEQVEESARKTAQLLAAEGVEAEIVRARDGAPPAVIGERKGPEGAAIVLLYAHHDVQPENDPADWDSPPFEPTVRGERLYGRGAADDKAGIAAHVGALRALGDDLPVTVRFFIEGEEEVASASLPDLLRQYRDRLASDVIVIADAGNWDIGVPSLTTSLRGLVRLDVEVRTLTHAVHSGMWGGLVPDAIMALTRLLATLWTEDGSPAVEGLVSTPAAEVDYPEERLRAESGAAPGTRWIGVGPVVERLWTQPAITVTGFDAPKVAGASNTLVPAARARVTVRLAPGDTSANALARLRQHLEEHVPWGAELTMTLAGKGEPTVLPTAGPAYAAARAALAEAWEGVDPVDMGSGGSIPFIAEFQEAFPGASILVTGVEDPDTRAHGPNEGLHLPEFERCVLAEALLLQRLGGA